MFAVSRALYYGGAGAHFDDLDLDSIDAIDLAVKLEERVGLDLEEEQLRSLRLVQDVVDLVHTHLRATADSSS